MLRAKLSLPALSKFYSFNREHRQITARKTNRRLIKEAQDDAIKFHSIMRRSAASILLVGAALAALFCFGRLVMNTTHSVPVGLWWRVDETLQRGDTVRVPIADFKSTDWMPKAKPLSYFIAHPDLLSPLNLFCHNEKIGEAFRALSEAVWGVLLEYKI